MRPVKQIHRSDFADPQINGLVLYRCYGLDGTLMYIGHTGNLRQRIQYHQYHRPWWFAVERISIQRYRNARVLRQDELRAIYTENPHFNEVGKGRRVAATFLTGCSGQPVFRGSDVSNYPEVSRGEDETFVFPQFKI